MGATHERIADPWLVRDDYGDGEPPDFNSMGTIYIGEQSLDTMLQVLELWRCGESLYVDENLVQKVYPDGVCYYSESIHDKPRADLQLLPSQGTLQVSVAACDTGTGIRWRFTADKDMTVQHRVWGLPSGARYALTVDGQLTRHLQVNAQNTLVFAINATPDRTHHLKLTPVRHGGQNPGS